MRTPLLLGLLFALTATLGAQDWGRTHRLADLAAFVASECRGSDFATHGRAYRAAAARGWLRDSTARALIKRQLKGLSRLRGRGGRFLDLRVPGIRRDPQGPPESAVKEVEYNDSEAYANDLGILLNPITVTGSIPSNADTDSFRFTTLLDGVATITLTVTGGQPDIMITNEHGDECWGYHYYTATRIVLPLPKGIYHVKLGGTSTAATYSIGLTFKNQALPALQLGKTTSHSFGLETPVCLEAKLPADGRLEIALTPTNKKNTYLIVQNSRWGYVYDVDDIASAANGEAGLDAQLPKGTYYIYLFADSQDTVAVKSTFTTKATPLLTTSATGTLTGDSESFDLYQVILGKKEQLDLRITGSGTSPIKDSYLTLYDRHMTQVLEGDDQPNDSLSSLGVTLPPGIYYVASNAYWDKGGYAISKSTSAGSTAKARAGTNPGSVANAHSSASLEFSLETPSWVEIDASGGTGFDVQIGVIDAKTGVAITWEDDENIGPQDCNLGLQLPAGDYLVLVKDFASGTGGFDARILPPLQRWANDNVMSRGHAGNPLFFLIGTKSAAPSNPLPNLISGSLLVDLNGALIVPLVTPAGGIIDFQTSLKPNSGVVVQMVDIDSSTALGVFSNVLK